MARGSRRGYTPDRRSGGGFGSFLLGFLFAAVVIGVWAYLKYEKNGLPVAAPIGKPSAIVAPTVRVPEKAEAPKEFERPPFGISEDVYEAGAKVYVASCAKCHGTPGHDSPEGRSMDPAAPQLWRRHAKGKIVGVSDDEPGETFGKVKSGIRQSGMPSFARVYSPTKIWQVSLLLKNADQPMPDPVMRILESGNASNPIHSGAAVSQP